MSATPQPEKTEQLSDPVRIRRRQIARWTRLANQVGYLCFLVSIVVFLLGLATSFSSTVSSVVITGLVIGSILLAPSIVLGYAIKAAERDDRERGL
jgi:hypothetical protein